MLQTAVLSRSDGLAPRPAETTLGAAQRHRDDGGNRGALMDWLTGRLGGRVVFGILLGIASALVEGFEGG